MHRKTPIDLAIIMPLKQPKISLVTVHFRSKDRLLCLVTIPFGTINRSHSAMTV